MNREIAPRSDSKESLKALAQVYKKFFTRPIFPKWFCVSVTREVASLGFKPEEGFFHIDKPIEEFEEKLEIPHAWCLDKEGNIIDLTAAQFNAGLEVPVKKGILISNPDDELYKRYEIHHFNSVFSVVNYSPYSPRIYNKITV